MKFRRDQKSEKINFNYTEGHPKTTQIFRQHSEPASKEFGENKYKNQENLKNIDQRTRKS